MRLEISEVMRIKGRLNDINNEMSNILSTVNVELSKVAGNILTSSLVQANNNLNDKISNLSVMLTDNLTQLEIFLGNQLESYTIANEEAKASLEGLVNIILGRFEADGSIIENPVNMNADGTNKMSDATITDSSGYESGEALQDVFGNKIGNSEEKWQVVNDTYYFFKEKGLSDEQIAGILGNMTQESALDLDCQSRTGKYKGLFQWDSSRSPSSWDLNSQLEHAWTEIESTRSNGKVLSNLSQTTTVDDATRSFAKWFEGYTGEMPQRQNYAKACYYYIKNNL